MNTSRITAPSIRERKGSRNKIIALTAYDYLFAKIIDEAGVDIVLVGDSLSSIVQGHATTLPVTLDEMIYHTKCVSKAVTNALVVGDLPFLSYQVSLEKAIESSGRLIKEGGAGAVKLEGGANVQHIIKALTSFDIPVMGHIGMTPQSYHRMGGYRVQGKKIKKEGIAHRSQIIEDALAVQESGAFAVVIECVPSELAEEITSKVSIPVIGIGAGSECDGQILVTHDMVGLTDKSPHFVKRFSALKNELVRAIRTYSDEVKSGSYPDESHEYKEVVSSPSLKVVRRK